MVVDGIVSVYPANQVHLFHFCTCLIVMLEYHLETEPIFRETNVCSHDLFKHLLNIYPKVHRLDQCKLDCMCIGSVPMLYSICGDRVGQEVEPCMNRPNGSF